MTVPVAIVGAGRMGRAHARELAPRDDVRIVGIADTRRDAAESLAAEHGAEAHTEMADLLDRCRPAAVYLCTPAAEHLDQLSAAAERGIHVFVEKPLAASVADAMRAAEIVEKTGILCAVGYQWRYSPVIDAVRRELDGRAIALMTGWWYWTIPLVPWIRDKRWGGGQVVDQGTHLIDLMRFLAGDVATAYAVYGSGAVPQQELPNWDANSVSLQFACGAVGNLYSTYALFPGIPGGHGIDVVARDLLIRLNPDAATVFRRDAEPQELSADSPWDISESFVAAVRDEKPELIRATAHESAASLAVSLAANYSAVTGNVVDLPAFTAEPPTDAEIMPIGSPPPA